MEIDGEVTAGEVLKQMNARTRNSNYNLVRNERGQIIRNTVLLTNGARVLVVHKEG